MPGSMLSPFWPRNRNSKAARSSVSTSSKSSGSSIVSRASFNSIQPEDLWDRKTILSLDGGGIRGYATLLILRHLMSLVHDIEQEHDRERDACQHASLDDPSRTVFKPHHYFDYFVGTSTGGLSAIMLGRLQMTVDQALLLYDVVGNSIFAKPRFPLLPVWSKVFLTRFNSEKMEQTLIAAMKDALHAELHRRKGEIRSTSSIPFENENRHASRTVVVTWGGNGTLETRLKRSYTHPRPTTSAHCMEDNNRTLDHKPFYKASRDPICKVARATSAAPTYFKSITIGEDVLFDGACGDNCNNPVQLAFDEVTQMHHLKPSVVVSIGTCKLKRSPDEEKKKNSETKLLPKVLLGILASMQESILDSEKTHESFAKQVRTENENLSNKRKEPICYHRFNIPADHSPHGVSNIQLDEWLPRVQKGNQLPGSITKLKMETALAKYLQNTDVTSNLTRCARELVHRRRRRAQDPHWEHFAFGVHYQCPKEAQCGIQHRYESRDELRKHLVVHHGIACRNEAGRYTCYTRHNDDVNGGRRSSSDVLRAPWFLASSSREFERHLSEFHGVQAPSLMDAEAVERCIDEGRKFPEEPPAA